MFRTLFVCLLLAAFASGQANQPAPSTLPSPKAGPAAVSEAPKTPETAPAPEPPKVGPDDVVLTIKNYCADTSLQGDACKTTLTKTQFEKLADALQPNMSPAMRRQLATAYARMLTMSAAAEKRELDKTPHFEEAMHFARMQILSQDLSKALQSDSNNVSDQDIKDFYDKNQANFQQATFIRIFVPHTKRVDTSAQATKKAGDKDEDEDEDKAADSKAAASKTKPEAKTPSAEDQEKAGEEAMKKEAARLRTRLVAGDDPEKLEKAAFAAGGLPGTPPPTKMENMRLNSLPPAHKAVMELKVNEISEVISDPSGNYIYKMVGKDELPLDKVKTEIKNQLSSQRYRDAMKAYQNNADLNDAYFGPSRTPGMPMLPRGGPKPPSKPGEDKDND